MLNTTTTNDRREALAVGQTTTIKLNLLHVNEDVLRGLLSHTDPCIRILVRREIGRRFARTSSMTPSI